MAMEVHQPVGCAAQEHFACISASSYLNVEQTFADGNNSPFLAITAVVAPEINIAISSAAQVRIIVMSATVDNDIVETISDISDSV